MHGEPGPPGEKTQEFRCWFDVLPEVAAFDMKLLRRIGRALKLNLPA